MFRTISVAPVEDGWAVRAGAEPPMNYPNGAEAERAARRLAERLATKGDPVRIDVHLRDGSLGGRFLVPPAVRETSPEPVVWFTPPSAQRALAPA
jgi:hypothetical protein